MKRPTVYDEIRHEAGLGTHRTLIEMQEAIIELQDRYEKLLGYLKFKSGDELEVEVKKG